MLAHYEKDFVGHKAIEIRIARNPDIVFRVCGNSTSLCWRAKKGDGVRLRLAPAKAGQMPKLAAYTPVKFSRGLITEVTDLEDPAHNLWGVCVVAPVEEVSGQVTELLHQELFLAGIFIGLVILASVALIGVALVF